MAGILEKEKIQATLNLKQRLGASVTSSTLRGTESEKVKLKGILAIKSSLVGSIQAIVKTDTNEGEILIRQFNLGETVSKYDIVALMPDGKVYKASADNSEHMNKVLGVSLEDKVYTGTETISVQVYGLLSDPSFSFTLGTVYLGINGAFSTNLPPTSACFTQVVGQAIFSDTIYISIKDGDFIHENSYTLIEAKEDISAYQLVTVDGYVAKSSNELMSDKVLGIAVNSILTGTQGKVLVEGIIDEPTFSFTPGQTLFLGLDGFMKETIEAGSMFLCKCGNAISSTKVNFKVEESILL